MRPDGYLDELKAARNAANAAPAARDDEERAEESAMMNTAKNLTSRLESMNIASSHAARRTYSSPSHSPKVATVSQKEPSVHMEKVRCGNGQELRISVTLPGCVSAREFEVELNTSEDADKSLRQCLSIKAPKLYTNPVIISLPPNVDEPSKSSFVRNTSKYCVRFPLRVHN